MRLVRSGASRYSTSGSQTNAIVITMTRMRSRMLAATPCFEVATTWTAAMNVSDGEYTRTPTMKAAQPRGLGYQPGDQALVLLRRVAHLGSAASQVPGREEHQQAEAEAHAVSGLALVRLVDVPGVQDDEDDRRHEGGHDDGAGQVDQDGPVRVGRTQERGRYQHRHRRERCQHEPAQPRRSASGCALDAQEIP